MNIVVSNVTTTTTAGNVHDHRPLYPKPVSIDFQSCSVCFRIMGYTEKQETVICNPCIDVGFYIDEDTGMIEDKRVDNNPDHQRIKAKVANEVAELDKSSPLYADMEDILEREKTNQLRLHTYADVWSNEAMTHKELCIKVLEAWRENCLGDAPEYYTNDEIADYVRKVGAMRKAELLSELVKWE